MAARTLMICSQMVFPWRFLFVVGLCFMPYESHSVAKCFLNSDLILYIKYQHLGYLHNQILLTNWLMQLDDTLKISSLTVFSFPLTILVYSFITNGSSTTLKKL
jgi:hypothetical protein